MSDVSSFFFNDTATTEIYTLSLHDALPISPPDQRLRGGRGDPAQRGGLPPVLRGHPAEGGQGGTLGRGRRSGQVRRGRDRKSTRLNSSHANISYAVFCLKKKHTQPADQNAP